MITLTNEIAASQSEESSEEGKEVKLCVNHQELQVPVKSLLQVLKSALQKKKIMQYLLRFHVCFVCTCSVVVQLIRRLPVLFVAKNDLKWLSMTEKPTELRSTLQHPGRTTSSLTVEKDQSTFTQDQWSLHQERMENLLKKIPNVSDLVIGLN